MLESKRGVFAEEPGHEMVASGVPIHIDTDASTIGLGEHCCETFERLSVVGFMRGILKCPIQLEHALRAA